MKGALKAEIVEMGMRNRMGGRRTQCDRLRGWKLIGKELAALGYELKSANSLKPKHIEGLLQAWHDRGLATGTIKNRMSWLRTWAAKTNKRGMIARENLDYGLQNRLRGTENKARKLDLDRLRDIPDAHVRMNLRLQAAFGLRMEEAMMIEPRTMVDWEGSTLNLEARITKGGVARVIPIRTERQRTLLREAAAMAGTSSLIPGARSLKQHKNIYTHQTLKHGLRNNHGLRHNYAQQIFRHMTGFEAPLAGGPKWADMTPAQHKADRHARQLISRELGHGRIEVSNEYLGSAFA